MKNALALAAITFWAALVTAGETDLALPRPHYHRQPGDPEWLAQAAQFHGHLGPWAVAGIRAGMAGRKAVRAAGYFDVQVEAEGPFIKPPHSCFLDGLQVGTGATLGKRNLTWKKADLVVVRVKNIKTNETAIVHFKTKLAEIIDEKVKTKTNGSDQRRTDDAVEAMARDLALSPTDELFIVALPKEVAQAEKAKAALLRLKRTKPQAYLLGPPPDELAKKSLIPLDNHRFQLYWYILDIEKKEYEASTGWNEGPAGGEIYNESGKFRVDDHGEWTAEEPQTAHGVK